MVMILYRTNSFGWPCFLMANENTLGESYSAIKTYNDFI